MPRAIQPKAKLLTPEQLCELERYLWSRFRRLQHGELYLFDGHAPFHADHALTIDTGLLLIALSECLDEEAVALSALKELMLRMVRASSDSGNGKTEADIDTERQLYLLRRYQALKNGFADDNPLWFVHTMMELCVGFQKLLFARESDGELAAEVDGSGAHELVDDAWEVIGTTMNLFGAELCTDSFPWDDETVKFYATLK